MSFEGNKLQSVAEMHLHIQRKILDGEPLNVDEKKFLRKSSELKEIDANKQAKLPVQLQNDTQENVDSSKNYNDTEEIQKLIKDIEAQIIDSARHSPDDIKELQERLTELKKNLQK